VAVEKHRDDDDAAAPCSARSEVRSISAGYQREGEGYVNFPNDSKEAGESSRRRRWKSSSVIMPLRVRMVIVPYTETQIQKERRSKS
jgi:hypothetical protein